MLQIKRAYEKMSTNDGKRIYIDRLWPRGLSKETAAFDEWLKELAPSNELRQWFSHEPDRFQEFRQKYSKELSSPEQQAQLERLADMAERMNVTLIYSARDTEHNNALVLAEVIRQLMKEKETAKP